MVDYCWAKWNIELDNDNTNDPAWNNTLWDHFVDGNGNPVTMRAGITPLMPLLFYRYETSAVGGFGAAMNLTALNTAELKKIETRLRKGANIRFEIKKRVPIMKGARLTISRPYSAETRVSADDFNALIESDRTTERIFVRINYAQLPPVNDFFVRVFIDQPNANARTRTDNVHYAGSFAFFGTHSHGHGKTDFLVNVTETLRNLKRRDQLKSGAPLSVSWSRYPQESSLSAPIRSLRSRKSSLLFPRLSFLPIDEPVLSCGGELMVMCKPTRQGIWKGGICLMLLVWLGNALGIAMAGNDVAGSSSATGYSLDLANRTEVKTISQEVDTPQAVKFVQIEVAVGGSIRIRIQLSRSRVERRLSQYDNIFDGCLKVDGDFDPTTAPHTALLPINLLFGTCAAMNYRLRLCPPTSDGCVRCEAQPVPGNAGQSFRKSIAPLARWIIWKRNTTQLNGNPKPSWAADCLSTTTPCGVMSFPGGNWSKR